MESIDSETKRAIATEMLKSQAFDNFMAIKFVTFKRYGGEGAESMMAFFHEFIKQAQTGNEHLFNRSILHRLLSQVILLINNFVNRISATNS